MAKRICNNCFRKMNEEHRMRLFRKGKSFPTEFCCYECYLDFWKGIKNFEPLKEDKVPEFTMFWWAEKIGE